jgi:triosephosphate isomerase (TIM)
VSTTTPGGRKPLISGNWKMHCNHFEAIQLVQRLNYQLTPDDFDAVDVSVHPPFTDLRSVQTTLYHDREPSQIALGAQHCHHEGSGAYTGEIAPSMLAKLEVRYVIAGHSERRELFGETDDDVNRKVAAILAADMVPILCVGETLDEREAGTTTDKVRTQVEAGLRNLAADVVAGVVISSEPTWATGTGRTASAEDAQTVCADIRAVVGERFGGDAAEAVRIQYGGSVKPGNAAELLSQPDIDGALVGGASLDADDFTRIVQHRLQ